MSRWVKVNKVAPERWQVAQVAEDCGCSTGDAFLALFRLFTSLEAKRGKVVTTSRDEVDAVTRLPGCAASLERIGWLAFNEDGSATIYAADEFVIRRMGRHCARQAVRPASKRKRKRGTVKRCRRKGGAK